jgi:hypothetical protein
MFFQTQGGKKQGCVSSISQKESKKLTQLSFLNYYGLTVQEWEKLPIKFRAIGILFSLTFR